MPAALRPAPSARDCAVNNVDAVLVLQRSDVAEIVLQRERFASTPLLCIDPGILDALIQAGLGNYQLRRLDVPSSLTTRCYTQAITQAAAIDMALTAEREKLWGDTADAALHGWDQTLLYLTLLRVFTQRALGQLVERSFGEERLGLLRPGNPALFHWDSMLYTDIVGADASRWSVVARYAHGRTWNPALLDMVFDSQALAAQMAAPAARPLAITHIPTCFYDAGTFAAAIEERFAHSIDLPAAYCDVPVRRNGPSLLRHLRQGDLDPRSLRYQERAALVIEDALRSIVPNRPALDHQVRAFARRCLLQAVAYTGLRQACAALPAGRAPHFVISDHDVGFNGPLFSVAAELGAPITVLPHSAYPTTLLPHGRQVTAVELDGVGVPVRTVLGAPVVRRAVRFRTPPLAAPRSQPRRVCLLLNTMLAEGISYVELFALIGLHRALAALCTGHGVELDVRAKPGAPALGVLAGALQLPVATLAAAINQPLAQAAQQADICIAFGEPTSATSAFLDAGSYVLHVSQLDWPTDYVLTTPLKGSLIPSLRCDKALAEMQRLLTEPGLYQRLQRAQAGSYLARRSDSQAQIFPAATAGALPPDVTPPVSVSLPASVPQELAPC